MSRPIGLEERASRRVDLVGPHLEEEEIDMTEDPDHQGLPDDRSHLPIHLLGIPEDLHLPQDLRAKAMDLLAKAMDAQRPQPRQNRSGCPRLRLSISTWMMKGKGGNLVGRKMARTAFTMMGKGSWHKT